MTNPYKKFTKDVGLVGIANIVTALKGLILLPILTKTLGASFYGILTQIMVTVSLLLPLCLLELQYAMTRFLTAEEDKNKVGKGISSIFVTVMLTASLISILVFILAEPLAVAVFGGAEAVYFVKITALLILLTALCQFVIQYFISFRQMERYSGFTILQIIGEVSLISYLVLSGYGLFGVISSLLLINAFTFTIGVLLIKSEVKIITPSLSVIKPYLAFSLPLIPFTLSFWMINSGDRFVIGYFMGADAIGIYSASYALGSILGFFYSPMALLIFPAITNLYENNKIRELKNYLKYSFKFFMMLSIPSLFGLSILSKSLLRTLTTPEFISGYTIVPIVALGVILFHSGNLFSEILVLFKRTKMMSLLYGLSALINLVMNIIMVPIIGISGAAIATLITFIVQSILLYFISFKMLSFDLNPKFITKSVFSSAIMGLLIWNMNPVGAVNILISIVVGAVVYFGLLLLLKGFTKEEYIFVKDIMRSAIQMPQK